MKKLLFCTHKVNRANIRRENRKGVEHIVLTSFTLPPNIVMNGGLYPSEEVDKSFESLNRTPVTVEHPEIDGVFVSAADPEIDFDYRFGAFNEKARKTDDGRIALDKVINVQKALKTSVGKRLLDRIAEIENNEKARPIHTSVGVFLEAEPVELSTNARGQEYTWVAKNMIFDHDAILFDSVGASTPDQGTGINVNKEEFKVEHYNCATPKKTRKVTAKDEITDNSLSFSEIEQTLHTKLNQSTESQGSYVIAVFDTDFIFETKEGEMFRSAYNIDDKDNLEIQDTRLPVERVVEYKTINPADTTEDNAMRDSIIAELTKLGIQVNADVSDAELLAQHTEALSAKDNADTDISTIVANAVSAAIKPLSEEVSTLKGTIKANSDKELNEVAEIVANSGQYPGLEASDIKALGLDKAKALAANCGTSYSIGSTDYSTDDNNSDTFVTNVEDLPD